jgi:hypothetical protein
MQSMFSELLEWNQKSTTENTGKFPNTWKLNKTFLNDPWLKEEIVMEITQYFKTIANEDTSHQFSWDAVKMSTFRKK